MTLQVNTAFRLFLPESTTQEDLKTLPRKQSTQGEKSGFLLFS